MAYHVSFSAVVLVQSSYGSSSSMAVLDAFDRDDATEPRRFWNDGSLNMTFGGVDGSSKVIFVVMVAGM